jgi:hypothetical protein
MTVYISSGLPELKLSEDVGALDGVGDHHVERDRVEAVLLSDADAISLVVELLEALL